MARVRRFVKDSSVRARRQPTVVDCAYAIVSVDGARYLQLNTYRSAERAIPGKISQTLQLDAGAAQELRRLIDEAFG